jgi:superoxide dismutase, Fe-Mn family
MATALACGARMMSGRMRALASSAMLRTAGLGQPLAGMSSSSAPAPFALPALPYDYAALEPHIDAMTMQIHHKRHHQTYISGLNGVIASPAGAFLAGEPLAEIQAQCAKLPQDIRTQVINTGGGHYNHTLFWSTIKPDGAHTPPAELRAKIDADFGELDSMIKAFDDAAVKRFGSGWAWLSVGKDGKLFISSTANQENPLMEGHVERPGTPILGLDVWEHAYYLKYQNRRPEYIQAFWQIVDWDQVAENYVSAMDGGTAIIHVPTEIE